VARASNFPKAFCRLIVVETEVSIAVARIAKRVQLVSVCPAGKHPRAIHVLDDAIVFEAVYVALGSPECLHVDELVVVMTMTILRSWSNWGCHDGKQQSRVDED
jgi:hypothetical protein